MLDTVRFKARQQCLKQSRIDFISFFISQLTKCLPLDSYCNFRDIYYAKHYRREGEEKGKATEKNKIFLIGRRKNYFNRGGGGLSKCKIYTPVTLKSRGNCADKKNILRVQLALLLLFKFTLHYDVVNCYPHKLYMYKNLPIIMAYKNYCIIEGNFSLSHPFYYNFKKLPVLSVHLVGYFIKLVTTSWTFSINC